jgi:ankyrin repeat protein
MKHLLLTTIAAVVLVGTAFADPIHDAAKIGDLAGVQAELDKGTDVNVSGNGGMTPLHCATLGGHKEVVELLIANGADVNAKDEDGDTPLAYAEGEIADLLRQHGGKTGDWLNADKSIHKAASGGNIEAIKQHLNGGANVDAKDEEGWTPLHFAAWFGHKEIVELLIAEGADVNVKDHKGRTPLNEAIETNQTKTADLLRTHGGKTGIEHIEDRLNSLNETLSQLQHLIIGDDAGGDHDEPSIEKLQGVFVIRGKVGGKYEVQYHTGDNDWLVREEITLTANRQLYIDSSSFDEKRFYRVKLVE